MWNSAYFLKLRTKIVGRLFLWLLAMFMYRFLVKQAERERGVS